VALSRLSRFTGFHNLDDLRKSPSGDEEGRSPFGEEVGRNGVLPPSGEERGRPPSGENEGRLMCKGPFVGRGERKDASGPLPVGR
jgi:hypothetical protein